MDLTPIKVASVLLKHHNILTCITGEVALNYYNVPRVCHDLEICVLKSSSQVAVSLLCSTGLFKSCELDNDPNNYTEYKRDIPRVRTTYWCPPQIIVIFDADFLGFDALEDIFVPPIDGQTIHISKEILLNRDDIGNLHLPRLSAFLRGLARRYLDTRDDVAMIAVEQLVDGMNIDELWVETQL